MIIFGDFGNFDYFWLYISIENFCQKGPHIKNDTLSLLIKTTGTFSCPQSPPPPPLLSVISCCRR